MVRLFFGGLVPCLIVISMLALCSCGNKKTPVSPWPPVPAYTRTYTGTYTPSNTPTETPTPVTQFFDDFEDTDFSEYSAIVGTPTIGTPGFGSTNRYLLDEAAQEYLRKGMLSVPFYDVEIKFLDDTADGDGQAFFRVMDNTAEEVYIYVNPFAPEPDYYYYSYDSNSYVSPVARSTGWHTFRVEKGYDGITRAYIDGILFLEEVYLNGIAFVFLGNFAGGAAFENGGFDQLKIAEYQ